MVQATGGSGRGEFSLIFNCSARRRLPLCSVLSSFVILSVCFVFLKKFLVCRFHI